MTSGNDKFILLSPMLLKSKKKGLVIFLSLVGSFTVAPER